MSQDLMISQSTDSNDVEQDSDEVLSSASQYLGFVLDGEIYCIDILSVNEIRGWQVPTALPNSPAFIQGVINIRGDIIPVTGMRERFNLESSEYDEHTAVIILHTGSNSEKRSMGFIVDSVSDVFNIREQTISKPAQFAGTIEAEYVKGLVNVDKQVVVVLDVEMLLSIEIVREHYEQFL